jgi:hypothetical protein
MIEALSTFKTSVLRRATRRNIPEDTILYLQQLAVFILVWGAHSEERTGL